MKQSAGSLRRKAENLWRKRVMTLVQVSLLEFVNLANCSPLQVLGSLGGHSQLISGDRNVELNIFMTANDGQGFWLAPNACPKVFL